MLKKYLPSMPRKTGCFRRTYRVRPLLFAGAGLLVAMGVGYYCAWLAGYRPNLSASLPWGLYRAVDAPTGLVEFCPPQPWGYIALKRQYRESGVCADYGSPLLKPIAASEGDRVEVSPAGIAVNGRLLPNTAPRPVDSMGRPLDHYAFGTYVIRPGEIWVASSWNYKSFDSRYFGPIHVGAIRQYLRPVWTWGRRNE
jgi:conjugative transfer signal peptidase TraF